MSEVNTVTLSLEDYINLRDFKRNMEMEYTCAIAEYIPNTSVYYPNIPGFRYISESEAVDEIGRANDKLKGDIVRLNEEIAKLQKENYDLKHPVKRTFWSKWW